MALLFVSSVYLCAQVYMCITENIREGWVSCGRQSHLCMCVCVCLCMLVCLSPGQGDTGISRDELLIEEAVIEVFKKVRGD